MLTLSSWVLCSVLAVINGDWVLHTNPSMPTNACNMAVGYWNDTIFLLGGSYNGYSDTQMMSYDIRGGTFTNEGSSYLETIGNSDGEKGAGGYYTQLSANKLFTISYDGDYIHLYRLDHLYSSDGDMFDVLEPAIPTDVASLACLASSTTPTSRLYVTGGYNAYKSYNKSTLANGTNVSRYIGGYLETVQVLELGDVSNEWLEDIPSMQNARYGHGCIVVEDSLFVVGNVKAIEAIQITDIQNSAWTEIGQMPVSGHMRFGQMVTLDAVIYVIGGEIESSIDSVYAIDTKTGDVTVHSTLHTVIRNIAPVVVDRTIYAFGGTVTHVTQWGSGDGTTTTYTYLDSWTTYNISTSEPSSYPTMIPTGSPTKSPTADPTASTTGNAPTYDPTQLPTYRPTVVMGEPSKQPTPEPTPFPTEKPSKEPTPSPTLEAGQTLSPSVDPTPMPTTFSPSTMRMEPTEDPTMEPTVGPTTEPTMEPTTLEAPEGSDGAGRLSAGFMSAMIGIMAWIMG